MGQMLLGASDVVAGFIAMTSELDPAPLLAALAGRGHELCLPFVQGQDRPLGFRRYSPGDPLVPGPHGTSEPASGAALIRPSVVLVPLLAFDRKGWRLGYGGGYYDRTLRALRAEGPVRAIGLAYAAQEVASVPHDERDERMDGVVTERGVVACAEEK
jgi:5-formyltetrahydrofolate cyclo-ligase